MDYLASVQPVGGAALLPDTAPANFQIVDHDIIGGLLPQFKEQSFVIDHVLIEERASTRSDGERTTEEIHA